MALMIRRPPPCYSLWAVLRCTLHARSLENFVHVLSKSGILPIKIDGVFFDFLQTNIKCIQLGRHASIEKGEGLPVTNQIRSRPSDLAQVCLQNRQLLLQRRLLLLVLFVAIRAVLDELGHCRKEPVDRRLGVVRPLRNAELRFLEEEVKVLRNDLRVDVALLPMTQRGHLSTIVVDEPLRFGLLGRGNKVVLETLLGQDYTNEVREGAVTHGLPVGRGLDVERHPTGEWGSSLFPRLQASVSNHVQARR
mmetsp:Transcript_23195/g.52549  ORF Transcript_23195/g.52549 Transcript_23195/m.52549 type:complete len:250 (-) Transcript_23195:147-896(-)